MSSLKPYYARGGVVLYLGDCREVLPQLTGEFDACVTDPPYGLSFMGKDWDRGVPGVHFWQEVYRALKPGAHALAFGGTRTHHRLVCAIEDAGFEIRDEIQWLYGSGFPKSLDIGKAIDKAAGAERGVGKPGPYSARRPRENVEAKSAYADGVGDYGSSLITAPATDAAKQWDGWGTALKPACEPICVARKPLEGTVAANVLRHGTGAINVDACRVRYASGADRAKMAAGVEAIRERGGVMAGSWKNSSDLSGANPASTKGRWPANVLLSHAEGCVCTGTKRVKGGEAVRERSGGNTFGGDNPKPALPNLSYADADGLETVEAWQCVDGCPVKLLDEQSGEKGGASRFFYCAKASKSDRGADNIHPTVKPTDLMRYLCRLVTPPGGVVLDPFMGSGSTGKAAALEGFRFVGIELDERYCEIAAKRIERVAPPLFAGTV